jgi:uncharacterized protein
MDIIPYMSKASLTIHPERLTAKGTVFEGTVRPGDLPGLAGDLANPDGELRYRIFARLDSANRRIISCIINGFVFLTCQSTFAAFRHDVAIDDRLVLVGSEAELPPFEEEGDAEDFMVATAPIDVLGLVEEAVILALPMVPRAPGVGPESKPPDESGAEKPSPFAALAGLKKRN